MTAPAAARDDEHTDDDDLDGNDDGENFEEPDFEDSPAGGDDDHDEDDEAPPRWSTPLRRTSAPGAREPRSHRVQAPPSSGTSSWLNAPREGFTAAQELRANGLSNSREGRSVRTSTSAERDF